MHLKNYLSKIRENGNCGLADAIQKTTDDIVSQYISDFSYIEHVVSLLMGNVQSGKTSHMFGLMCAAADEGFGIFVVLTTDSVALQQQTLKRAQKDLESFFVCDETDYTKFVENNMRKPSVIVLKKNPSVLKQWKNNFSSTAFCAGNPLFIIDDEADAASLNIKVNQRNRSTINRTLDEIKKTTSSSIYLQVTGTPQAILLQTAISGWKPYFFYYFEPGKGYLGGEFFFTEEGKPQIVLTDNGEAQEILSDDEFPENGLKYAVVIHLITSAQTLLKGGDVCNFLIHPSFRTLEHQAFAEKVGKYLNDLSSTMNEDETIALFRQGYDNLSETALGLLPFDTICSEIFRVLRNDEVSILLMNSKSEYIDSAQYESGVNILIGGNSLGRGVTFPKLQTIYYCRLAKSPQADTMWQHSRMFGYDRDPYLMRVFMSPRLFKLFSDINTTNNALIAQLKVYNNPEDIKMYYASGLRPTRKNVLDRRALDMVAGGVNYFPFYPENETIEELDKLLEPFEENKGYQVSLKLIVAILAKTDSEGDDWSSERFIGFIKSYISENPARQGKLIVRRERDISKGTGTLLSPNDRVLSSSYKDDVVLTMYKVTGNKGWDGRKIWIPNIKLPNEVVFYDIQA